MSTVFEQPERLQHIVQKFDLRNAAAIVVGDTIFTSGFGAFDIETGQTLPGDDIRTHAMHAVDTYEYVLSALGLGLDHVVKVNAFLRHPERDYPAWNEVFQERFTAPYPCRTTVGGGLVAGIVELDFTVARTPRRAADTERVELL